jgi:hypothetical protein
MTLIFVHLDGQTRQVDRIDPAWLDPEAASRSGST